MATIIEIDISTLYKDTETAKLSMIEDYIQKAKDMAGEGKEVVLTGAGPIWLYLKVAHALHGLAKKLIYRSPVTGDVVIFDHSPE
ncbi:CRISPR-associated protein Csx3 [Thermodesulfovibrio sp.]|uniref:CRISPR-associated protein Csx3 n=1 Tax=Thermodesulfovibrio sp. TaxID=2067987 RepID=UPI0030B6C30C